jgi:phage gpG-like protein
MNEIGSSAAKYYSNQGFNSQGGVFGSKWSPLARRTILRKSKTYPGRSPLVATGKMRDSFTYTASNRQVLIGNKMDYFKYHQSTLPRKKLPRRQTMGINSPIKQMIQGIVSAEVKRKIKAA